MENTVISMCIAKGSASGSGVPPGLQSRCFRPKAGRVGSIPTRSRQNIHSPKQQILSMPA